MPDTKRAACALNGCERCLSELLDREDTRGAISGVLSRYVASGMFTDEEAWTLARSEVWRHLPRYLAKDAPNGATFPQFAWSIARTAFSLERQARATVKRGGRDQAPLSLDREDDESGLTLAGAIADPLQRDPATIVAERDAVERLVSILPADELRRVRHVAQGNPGQDFGGKLASARARLRAEGIGPDAA